MGKKAVLAFVSTLLALAFASKEAASSINISLVNVLPEEFAPATEIRGKELLLLTNVTRLEVRCSAKFPIQWEFKGDTVRASDCGELKGSYGPWGLKAINYGGIYKRKSVFFPMVLWNS